MRPTPSFGVEDLLLLGPVLVLPWVFGGTDVWSSAPAALVLVAGASLALVRRGLPGWSLRGRADLWILPAVLLGLWAALQTVPLPPGLIRLASPAAHRIYEASFPAGQAGVGALTRLEDSALAAVPEAADVSAAPTPAGSAVSLPDGPLPCASPGRTLSLEPARTRSRLAWFGALLLAFLAIRERVADDRRYRLYRAAIFVSLTCLAAFALLQAQSWNGKLYWVRTLLNPDVKPFGPYVNPTHFCGLMEMGVPWMAAYAWSRFRRVGRAALYEASAVGGAVGAGLGLVAGLGTASKFGAVLLLAGLLGVALAGVRGARARGAILVVALLLCVAAVPLVGGTYLSERLSAFVDRVDWSSPLGDRWQTWKSGAELIQDFPLTGVGFGAFSEVFEYYQPAGQRVRWKRLHNDYLQVIAAGGAIAGALMLWLGWAFWRRAIRCLASPALGDRLSATGLGIGVGALSLHALVDWNHQIPANALVFVALAALLVRARPERGAAA